MNTLDIITNKDEAIKAYIITKGVSDMTMGDDLEKTLEKKGIAFEKKFIVSDRLWTIEYQNSEGFWRTVLCHLAVGADSWYENYDYFTNRVRLEYWDWLDVRESLERRY